MAKENYFVVSHGFRINSRYKLTCAKSAKNWIFSVPFLTSTRAVLMRKWNKLSVDVWPAVLCTDRRTELFGGLWSRLDRVISFGKPVTFSREQKVRRSKSEKVGSLRTILISPKERGGCLAHSFHIHLLLLCRHAFRREFGLLLCKTTLGYWISALSSTEIRNERGTMLDAFIYSSSYDKW